MNLSIDVPVKVGAVTQKVLELVNESEELFALWEVTNVVAQKRLHMTDHGIKHFQIVTDTALSILDFLHSNKTTFSLEKDYHLAYDYSQTVVLLASILHDVGMSVHREGHEEFSLFIAHQLLEKLLQFLPVRERIIMRSEVLHAIISHRSGGKPLTIEAGVVRVADALDLTRDRISAVNKNNNLTIHEVSADSIDSVTLTAGKKVPIVVDIVMNHTAGLFQVDELLKRKVDGSGIEHFFDIKIILRKMKNDSC
ncbi:MAG: HD domain-containing protein [bacterium]|nr:HD domain-containing protein [bacterium]